MMAPRGWLGGVGTIPDPTNWSPVRAARAEYRMEGTAMTARRPREYKDCKAAFNEEMKVHPDMVRLPRRWGKQPVISEIPKRLSSNWREYPTKPACVG